MKIQVSKKWFSRKAPLEEGLEIGAGSGENWADKAAKISPNPPGESVPLPLRQVPKNSELPEGSGIPPHL